MAHTPVWPRERTTGLALLAMLALQAVMFLAVTSRSSFTHEDFYHFALAQDRPLLHYVLTPIIHTYPAPGHRLLFSALYGTAPMSYDAARAVLLALLVATTFLLGHLVRTLARSEHWWTVAVLTPFALSLSLVGPVNLWANGVPVIPALLFTVVAVSAWIRSCTDDRPALWVGITVAALAGAGAFYMKFVLVPVFLLFMRLAIVPRMLGVPGGMQALWQERLRWLAIAAPPAVFLAVYVFSGLAERSLGEGSRPYLEYLATAWVGAVVPLAVFNVPLTPATPALWWWTVVVASHAVLGALVVLTCRRSPLAPRAWLLFAIVFVTNTLMVGAARLPGFGVEIAYWLRYYPEVVLFAPIVLALCLRAGDERRANLAWERSRTGRAAMAAFAAVHAIAFAVWAPGIVAGSDGVRARPWMDNLRHDLGTHLSRGEPLRIVDADTPDFIVLWWMEPYNRVSTILRLLGVEARYNDLGGPLYRVRDDGRLEEAVFRPARELVPGVLAVAAVRSALDGEASGGRCLNGRAPLEYRPDGELVGEPLALRVSYSAPSRQHAFVEVERDDPDRPLTHLLLRPLHSAAELIDLGPARVRSLRITASPGDEVCVARLEIGRLVSARSQHVVRDAP